MTSSLTQRVCVLVALSLLWNKRCCANAPFSGSASAGPPPPLTNNVTLIALRPYNLTGLDNKDSANLNGEALFYFNAKLMLPMQCRSDPSYFECDDGNGTGRLLRHDEVYTMYNIENTGSYAIYAACNPDLSIEPWGTPSAWNCTTLGPTPHPTVDPRMGMTHMCGDYCGGPGPRDSPFVANWTCAISNVLGYPNNSISGGAGGGGGGGGFTPLKSAECEVMWYSHPGPGNCDSNPGPNCTWRVAETVKIVNASCVHQHLIDFVVAKDPSCFEQCTPDPSDVTTDCFLKCFFNVAVANATLGTPGMNASELMRPWTAAFESEDPAQMGCPALPPYHASNYYY